MRQKITSKTGLSTHYKDALETTNLARVGSMLVMNLPRPIAKGAKPNCWVMNEAAFNKRYESSGDKCVYRAKGRARILRNPTGGDISIEAPWGELQHGDKDCMLAMAVYDAAGSMTKDRYILSVNDFRHYAPELA